MTTIGQVRGGLTEGPTPTAPAAKSAAPAPATLSDLQRMTLYGGLPGYDAYGVSTAKGPGSTPWWDDNEAQNPNLGGAGQDYTAVQNLPTASMGMSPEYFAAIQKLGYTGPDPNAPDMSGGNPNAEPSTAPQQLSDWLAENGYISKTSFLDQKGTGDQISALFDKNGNEVMPTQRQYASDVNSDAFLGGILGATGFGAAAAAGAGAGVLGGTEAAAPSSAGLSSSDLASLYGNAGYGGVDGAGGLGLAEGATPASLLGGPEGAGLADGAGGASLAEGATPASLTGGASGASSAGSSLLDKLGGMTTGQQIGLATKVLPLLGALGSLGGTSTTKAPATGPTPGSPSTEGALGQHAAVYNYQGTHPYAQFSTPPNTSGPSAAVNLHDPSAAMFGYAPVPIYYQQPGVPAGATPTADPDNGRATAFPTQGVPMADGGSVVSDDYGSPLQLGGGAPMSFGSDNGPGDAPGNSASYPATPVPHKGILDWISSQMEPQGEGRDANGRKTGASNMMLGMGALGVLSALLNKHKGYQTPQMLHDSLVNQSGGPSTNATRYFNKPADVYTPPANGPFGPSSSRATGAPNLYQQMGGSMGMADGGTVSPPPPPARFEPKVGTYGPVHGGGGGALTREAIVQALINRQRALAASAPGSAPSGMGSLPANPVVNPGAILNQRMNDADAGGYCAGGRVEMAVGGGVPGMPMFTSGAQGAMVAGPGGGQDDKVDASLSAGEYVHPSDVVSALGDGNNAEGAKRLREMETNIRAHKRATPTNTIPPKAMHPLAYLAGRK